MEAKKKVVEKLKLNDSEFYTVIGTGKSKHLAKDSVNEVGGDVARYLIEKGLATLKK